MELREVPSRMPGSDEVRIRVAHIGICGSDIGVWHSEHPFTPLPVVLGHEFCGLLDALGSEVTGLKAGTLVTAMTQIIFGICAACKNGHSINP